MNALLCLLSAFLFSSIIGFAGTVDNRDQSIRATLAMWTEVQVVPPPDELTALAKILKESGAVAKPEKSDHLTELSDTKSLPYPLDNIERFLFPISINVHEKRVLLIKAKSETRYWLITKTRDDELRFFQGTMPTSISANH